MNYANLNKQLQTQLVKLQGSVGLKVSFLVSHEEFNYNQEQQFMAASTIKVPIATAFYSKVASNEVSEHTRIKLDIGNKVLGSGILKLLDDENTYTYKDLVTFMLTISDNFATNQIIDLLGKDFINEHIKQVQLASTEYNHKLMLWNKGEPDNITTPKDMSNLLEQLYKNELPGASKVLEIMSEQVDRTRIPRYISGNVKISYKNGTLKDHLHEVGIIFTKNPFTFCFYSANQQDKKLTSEVLSLCAKLCYEYSLT